MTQAYLFVILEMPHFSNFHNQIVKNEIFQMKITWLVFEQHKDQNSIIRFLGLSIKNSNAITCKIIFDILFGHSMLPPRRIFIQPTRHRGMGTWKWQQQNYSTNASRWLLCLGNRAIRCRQRFLQKVILHFIKTCAGKR